MELLLNRIESASNQLQNTEVDEVGRRKIAALHARAIQSQVASCKDLLKGESILKIVGAIESVEWPGEEGDSIVQSILVSIAAKRPKMGARQDYKSAVHYFTEKEWEDFSKNDGQHVLDTLVCRLFRLGCRSLTEPSKNIS